MPGTRPNFKLDGVVDLGFIFLRGVLSEKEHIGFSPDRETPGQPAISGDDNEAPTGDDWKNLITG